MAYRLDSFQRMQSGFDDMEMDVEVGQATLEQMQSNLAKSEVCFEKEVQEMRRHISDLRRTLADE